MGEPQKHIIPWEAIPEKKFRLADFFNAHWDSYVQSPKKPIKPEHFKAVNALRVCRTPVLGVDIYACPECGEIKEVSHSCKHRFCPTCSWKETVNWAEKVKYRMLNIAHRHVVCTLPHSLIPLIKQNSRILLGALQRSAAATFSDWIGNKHRLKIGVVSVSHTFGELKTYHPHVHMIVSWGGIHKKTEELIQLKEDEFVNYKFLKKKFRCKFEDELVALFDKELLLNDFRDRTDFVQFIQSINKKSWIIHLEEPISHPGKVIRYIGRYSKRACISEYKITKMEGENIAFRYKDYKDRDADQKPVEKEVELHYRDFFPRLLQHVPEPYSRTVRYYGLYSNKGNCPDEYLYQEQCEETTIHELDDEKHCEFCNREMEYIHTSFQVRFWINKKTGSKKTICHIVIRKELMKKRSAA